MIFDHDNDLIIPDGTNTAISFGGTDGIILPTGSTGSRPSGVVGMLRYNTDTQAIEGFQNASWSNVVLATNGGAASVAQGGTGLTSLGTGNQILSVNPGATALEYKTVSAGTGITVTPSAGTLSIANTGVTAIVAGSGISINQGTGSVTITATSGGGSVTNVSVVTANGFAGTVATASTTPAITLTTTASGVLKGNGTAISAAVSGTDIKTVNGTSLLGFGDVTTGTVTSVSVTSANGVSGTVATATTTPAITLSLGAITPTSVNGVVISGSATPTLAVTGTSSISGSHSGTSSGTNTGDQTITLTGDVTGSGTGSFAATIGANKVTNSQLAQVSTATFKGRTTAGTGNVEDLTATQATALLDTATTSLKGLMSSTDKKRMTQVFDAVADFGFVGDLKQPFVVGVGYDGAMTSGSATLTCATTAPFAPTDVGKRITVSGAGAGGAMLVTTIQSFTSSTTVTLAATAGTTVSAKCVRFGTDNTTAINNMVTAVNTTYAAYPNIKIYFPPSETNAYGFPIAALFNKPVTIEGVASTSTTDVGDYTRSGGTCLSWWGNSSTSGMSSIWGAMLEFAPTTGINNTPLEAVCLKNFWVDCRNGDQNQAVMGIDLTSCANFVIDNVYIMDALAVALDMDVVAPGVATPAAGSLGMAKDTTRGSIKNFRARMLDNTSSPSAPVTTPITTTSAITLSTTGQTLNVTSTTGFYSSGYLWVATTCGVPALVNYTGTTATSFTGCTISAMSAINPKITVSGSNIVQATPGNGACVRLNGDSGANTCCNTFDSWQLAHGTTWGPAAIEFENSDSNVMTRITINGGNATNDGAINRIRKPGVRFNGSTTAANLSARNNVFYGGSAGAGGVVTMALTNAGALLAGLPAANYWDRYELGNGEPVPYEERRTTSATQGDSGTDIYAFPNGGFARGIVSVPAVTAQAITAATLTHIKGTLVPVPPQGFQVGTVLRWTITMTKTAAGTAANTFHIRLGTTGSTADAVVATFAPATLGTAVADTGTCEITFTVRTLGATATAMAHLRFTHNLASTGWFVIPIVDIDGTMSTFNTTTTQQFLSVTMRSGASVVPTVQQAFCECLRP